MPPPLMCIPVASVIVPVFTPISALVGLGLNVHVHSVPVHLVFAHETFATVLTVETLFRIIHVNRLHVEVQLLNNQPTNIAC